MFAERHLQQAAECHLGTCGGAEHDSTQHFTSDRDTVLPSRVETLLEELVQTKQTNPSVLLYSLTIPSVLVKAASEMYL